MNVINGYIYNENIEISEIQLKEGLYVELFNPKLLNFKQHKDSIFKHIYWYMITLGKYKIAYVKNENKEIVHYSYVFPKTFKYKFLTQKDMFIGPCWTAKNSRGNKLYPYTLNHIIKLFSNRGIEKFYIIINKKNIPSQNGVKKSGFEYCGEISVRKFLGLSIFNLDR